MDVKFRLVSKTFMKAFDELCSEQLLLLDPRTKFLTHDDDGKAIISSLGTFLPKSVPLFILYTSYLDIVYPMLKDEFNENFPVLEIPENGTEESVLNLRNQQRDIDFERIKKILCVAFHMGYNDPTNCEHPPMTFFCLYRLLRVIFPDQAFVGDFVKSTGFPLNKLLTEAASGKLLTPYGVEILSRFSINSKSQLLFDSIESGDPELVRAIFNNPNNDLVLLMSQRSRYHFEPMNVAAVKGNVDIINLFLNWGIPADSEGIRRFRPIHLAARHGNYDAVARLFEFDNDVTFSSLDDLLRPCPIVLAALNGHLDIVRFFLTQDKVDLKEDRETTRLLIEAAVLRKDAELGNSLIDSDKLVLTSAEVDKLKF